MLGIFVNVVGIVLGTIVGLFAKKLISKSVQERIEVVLGFCTLIIAIRMALKFDNVFCLIGSLIGGGLIGYWLKVETRMEQLGVWSQKRLGKLGAGEFAKGFTLASILYTSGAMAVVGSINSGLLGDHELLYTKAILDGIISISFGSVYGIGVAFSAIPVFLYQGAIALGASSLEVLAAPKTIADISGVGGVLVMMIALNLLNLRKTPVGDFLPAMALVIAYHLLAVHY